ncbi:MAG: EI24 domain-containing protein [Flavobacteriales bacterium]|nr:EI24 domain-containing protein [Flavobacteriales bacterium]
MLEKFLKGFSSGIKQHLTSLSFLRLHSLSYFLLFPILFNLMVWLLGIELVTQFADAIMIWMEGVLREFSFGPLENSWMATTLYWIIWIALRILLFITFAYLGGYMVLIFMTPVLAWLSHKVNQIETKENVGWSSAQMIKDIFRGIYISLRNFLFEWVILTVVFLFGFVPFLGFFAPILFVLIAAYFYGFSFMDYSMENRCYGISKTQKFLQANLGSTLAIGLPFALVLLLPFIGPFIAGFIAITSIVAGAREVNRILT